MDAITGNPEVPNQVGNLWKSGCCGESSRLANDDLHRAWGRGSPSRMGAIGVHFRAFFGTLWNMERQGGVAEFPHGMFTLPGPPLGEARACLAENWAI